MIFHNYFPGVNRSKFRRSIKVGPPKFFGGIFAKIFAEITQKSFVLVSAEFPSVTPKK